LKFWIALKPYGPADKSNIVLGTSTARIPGQEGVVLRKVLPWMILTAVLTGIANVLSILF